MSTTLVTAPASTVLVTTPASTTVVTAEKPHHVVVTRGIPGPPGKNGDGSGALLIDNRLNEFAGNTAAQAQAQANLGLGLADPLAYYILAKS